MYVVYNKNQQEYIDYYCAQCVQMNEPEINYKCKKIY